MAMLFMDGFDYILTTANLPRKWDTGVGSGGSLNNAGVYGNGKSIVAGSSNPPQKTLPSNYTTLFSGFHLVTPSVFGASSLMAFLDANTIQVDIRWDATGALFFTRNGTTIGVASTNRLVANTWYWFELKVTFDPSAGVAEVRVNGQTSGWLAQSGLNTRATTNSFANHVRISNGNYDSFHVWDTTGTVNTYIGEHEILTELPNAVGSNAAWTKGGSTINANNYQQVNEANADDDTTYVSSSTPGQIDSYNFSDISQASGTIAAIAVNTIDRDDDATPRVFHHYTKSGVTTFESGDIVPSSGYLNHQSIQETDPNTSAAWTIANLNATEFGVKEIS